RPICRVPRSAECRLAIDQRSTRPGGPGAGEGRRDAAGAGSVPAYRRAALTSAAKPARAGTRSSTRAGAVSNAGPRTWRRAGRAGRPGSARSRGGPCPGAPAHEEGSMTRDQILAIVSTVLAEGPVGVRAELMGQVQHAVAAK